MKPTPLIDSHAHVVSDDFTRYPVSPLSGTLDRKLDDPMTAEKLLAAMDAQGVERAVLVQRAHVYGYENSYVCDMAARYPDRFDAVVCIDAAALNGAERARYWIQERGAVGLRLTEPSKGANLDWFAGPAAAAVWRLAAELKASLCLHMYRWNRVEALRALHPIATSNPTVPVVLDHVSNIVGEAGPPDFGIDEPLLALKALGNVYLKVTMINFGKLLAAGQKLEPLVAQVVRAFDANHLMWGSDIGQSPGSYAELVQYAIDSVQRLSVEQQRAVLHRTTANVYGQRWATGA